MVQTFNGLEEGLAVLGGTIAKYCICNPCSVPGMDHPQESFACERVKCFKPGCRA